MPTPSELLRLLLLCYVLSFVASNRVTLHCSSIGMTGIPGLEGQIFEHYCILYILYTAVTLDRIYQKKV